jgi:hypothetical protein
VKKLLVFVLCLLSLSVFSQDFDLWGKGQVDVMVVRGIPDSQTAESLTYYSEFSGQRVFQYYFFNDGQLVSVSLVLPASHLRAVQQAMINVHGQPNVRDYRWVWFKVDMIVVLEPVPEHSAYAVIMMPPRGE